MPSELTDEQIEKFLVAITRPMFNWRMGRARATHHHYHPWPAADSPMARSGQTAYTRALAEIRRELEALKLS